MAILMKVAELGNGEFGKGQLNFKSDNQRCTLGSGDFDRKMANFAKFADGLARI